MNWIRHLRDQAALTQAELARAGGSSQPTIAAYEAAQKSPSVTTIERLARSVGLEAAVTYHPPMTREERRSLALHQAIAKRLRSDPTRIIALAKRNLARMQSRAGVSSQPLREWEVLLDRPPAALLPLLVDTDPWARELRQVTPFAGVLSAAERADVYRRFGQASRKER